MMWDNVRITGITTMSLDLAVEHWSITSSVVRGQRDQLIRFWLSCPDDLLEPLWAGPAGQASREMVAQLSTTSFFTDHQRSLRNRLGEFLHEGFQQPGAVKVVIATFLLSPPGQFRILNPESHLPSWLIPSYRSLYEQGQQHQSVQKTSSSAHDSESKQLSTQDLSKPDFGEFPNSLEELLGNRLQLNRLLGLSNLYYIDPEDNEIRKELLGVRASLAQILMNADETLLEQSFGGDFGDRYWALVRSGIQSVPLDDGLQQLKQKIKHKLSPEMGGGFGVPGSISAFLVAMMLYEPGTMQVNDAEQKLPQWLLLGYKQIFSAALNN